MIVRDAYGIIVQHPTMDGGDSASRAGIMALCGSKEDELLLPFFTTPTGLVRHPFQEQWNKSGLTSRDQLICFAAKGNINLYLNSWFINKDFLMPDVRLYLYTCAGVEAPLFLKALGRPLLFISILWNCYIRPASEQNQIACICIVMGPAWVKLLKTLHPDLHGNIMSYWSGWRDQAEIGRRLCDKL